MDVSSGQLMDPTTVAIIQDVLTNFDPTQFNEDEFVFDAQAKNFNNKRRTTQK